MNPADPTPAEHPQTRMRRPFAASKAYRIVAAPHNGWLYNGEWWTNQEWRQAENRRRYERVRKQSRRAA